MQSITLKVGRQQHRHRHSSITLTVGPSSVKLEMAGVTVSGMTVKVNGQMQTEVKAGMMCRSTARRCSKLQGGITMIN